MRWRSSIQKPLYYAHAIGLDPAQVGGRAETQLHFKLPLLADLKFDAIEYSAKSTMSAPRPARSCSTAS